MFSEGLTWKALPADRLSLRQPTKPHRVVPAATRAPCRPIPSERRRP